MMSIEVVAIGQPTDRGTEEDDAASYRIGNSAERVGDVGDGVAGEVGQRLGRGQRFLQGWIVQHACSTGIRWRASLVDSQHAAPDNRTPPVAASAAADLMIGPSSINGAAVLVAAGV